MPAHTGQSPSPAPHSGFRMSGSVLVRSKATYVVFIFSSLKQYCNKCLAICLCTQQALRWRGTSQAPRVPHRTFAVHWQEAKGSWRERSSLVPRESGVSSLLASLSPSRDPVSCPSTRCWQQPQHMAAGLVKCRPLPQECVTGPGFRRLPRGCASSTHRNTVWSHGAKYTMQLESFRFCFWKFRFGFSLPTSSYVL